MKVKGMPVVMQQRSWVRPRMGFTVSKNMLGLCFKMWGLGNAAV